MSNSNIWSDINISKNASKNILNRNHLKMYMEMHHLEDISRETFLDYFDINSLGKYDEQTGYYLPHLLFLDYYDEQKLLKVFEFAFEYVSQYQLTEKEGYNFLDCMFQRNTGLESYFVNYMLENSIDNLDIDLDEHTDFYGNSLLHWAYIGNGFPYELHNLYQYFHNNVFDKKNTDNLRVIDLYILAKKMESQLYNISLQSDKYIIEFFSENSDVSKCVMALNNSKINNAFLSQIGIGRLNLDLVRKDIVEKGNVLNRYSNEFKKGETLIGSYYLEKNKEKTIGTK